MQANRHVSRAAPDPILREAALRLTRLVTDSPEGATEDTYWAAIFACEQAEIRILEDGLKVLLAREREGRSPGATRDWLRTAVGRLEAQGHV